MRRKPLHSLGTLFAGAAILSLAGCTFPVLRNNMVSMSSTISDIQYQIVLDNLAMFVDMPGALPWQIQLESGTVQLTDRARLEIGDPFTGFGAYGRRSATGEWHAQPVTDPEELRDLQALYRLALGKSVQQKVRKRLKSAANIHTGWFHSGRKKDVPKDARYVGHYRDTYVWVSKHDVKELTEFTLGVLTVVKFKKGERDLSGGLLPTPD